MWLHIGLWFRVRTIKGVTGAKWDYIDFGVSSRSSRGHTQGPYRVQGIFQGGYVRGYVGFTVSLRDYRLVQNRAVTGFGYNEKRKRLQIKHDMEIGPI